MRSQVRASLLLPLLATLVLEGVNLVHPLLIQAVHRAYPTVALDQEGRVMYYDAYRERRADGTVGFAPVLDTTRNPVAILDLGPSQAMGNAVLTGAQLVVNLGYGDPRFLKGEWWAHERPAPLSPLERVAVNLLQPMEAARRGITLTPGQPEGTLALDLAPNLHGALRVRMPIEWRLENGRLVCRETATGRVLAGVGPDGYATGDQAAEGERFGRIDAGPIAVRPGLKDTFEYVLLDGEGRKLHALSLSKEQAQARNVAADSTGLVPVGIETRPLRPLTTDLEHDTMPFLRIADRHLLVFLADGSVVTDVVLEPGERVTSTTGALLVWSDEPSVFSYPPPKPKLEAVGVETMFAVVRWDEERRRLRLFRPGQPDVVRDVVLLPTRASEVLLANLTASLALLRPVPLAVASALSPLPTGRPWWWRDPCLAAGSYPGWLALSLALAAFCAWRARRAARERCATVREVRLWTAAVLLLGPVGLLWMRLVLPRVPVEAVGKARRAVNLDASPSTSAPWPEPARDGIEVFG